MSTVSINVAFRIQPETSRRDGLIRTAVSAENLGVRALKIIGYEGVRNA